MLGKISAISACLDAMTTYVTLKAATFSYAISASGAAKCVFLRDALSTSLITAVSSILLLMSIWIYKWTANSKKRETKETKPLLTFLMKTWTKVKS